MAARTSCSDCARVFVTGHLIGTRCVDCVDGNETINYTCGCGITFVTVKDLRNGYSDSCGTEIGIYMALLENKRLKAELARLKAMLDDQTNQLTAFMIRRASSGAE